MGWIRTFWRTRILCRRLAKAEHRFDVLSRQLDVLNLQEESSDRHRIAQEIDAIDAICDEIEDELQRLGTFSLSRWLASHAIEVSILLLVAGVSFVQWTRRYMRHVPNVKKLSTKSLCPWRWMS
jgi:hypothetical protein